MDIAFLFEGRDEKELPERLVGVARFDKIDIEQHEDLFDDDEPVKDKKRD